MNSLQSEVSILNNLTIAIPTYNREEFLKSLIKSISSPEVEILISDNGCFLDEEFNENNPQISVYKVNPSVGLFENWNNCLRKINTKWFIMPSDDDIFYPDTFVNLNKVLSEYDDYDIIIFGHNVINGVGDIVANWIPQKLVKYSNGEGIKEFIFGIDARFPSIVFKTELLDKVGVIDEAFEYTAGDSLFIQRYLIFGKSAFIPKILSGYRTWSENYTNMRIGTSDWLKKIDIWQDTFKTILENERSTISKYYNLKKVKDEVYASNLLQSIKVNIRTKGRFGVIKFVLSNRYPFRANLISQLRLLKLLIFSSK